ncbi:MAG: GvpL/GvpF family gas vesicle protein [Candidatus Binatia bacterium]
MEADGQKGRYLYCIAAGGEKVSLGPIGIEGNEVYTLPYQRFCAVVHNCRAQPYTSADQEVVKPWFIVHQHVVDVAWERFGTVLPLGFDTIIRGGEGHDPDENIKGWLKGDYDNLREKMEKIRGKAEYGVQILWDPMIIARKITETNPDITKLDAEMKSKPRGAAYLYKQKLEKVLKGEMEREADRHFKDCYHRIKRHVDDLRVDKTKKLDKDKQMLMNLSCLLSREKSTGLGEELEEMTGREGFSIRFTGPWPPYSFVTSG